LTQIYDSDRISGATDMDIPARAHGIGTPGLYSGQIPQRLWPNIEVEGLNIRIRKLLCKPI
jgi:hypothetical protein